jgi:hypothetical protein
VSASALLIVGQYWKALSLTVPSLFHEISPEADVSGG